MLSYGFLILQGFTRKDLADEYLCENFSKKNGGDDDSQFLICYENSVLI